MIQHTSTWTRFALVAALAIAGCGGGGGGNPEADADVPAGPDAGPEITGNTAKGVYPAARSLALGEQPDAVLYRIQGERLIAGGAEVDPQVLQSYWSFAFISPSTGIAVDVLYAAGNIDYSTRQDNPEGKRLFTTDWIDSDEAVAKLDEAGYVAPDSTDLYTTVGMKLEMYGGPDPDLQMIAEPIWRLNKVEAPPGETPRGEEWWVTYWTGGGGYLVCDPTGMCAIL